jgi:hypothetical protein
VSTPIWMAAATVFIPTPCQLATLVMMALAVATRATAPEPPALKLPQPLVIILPQTLVHILPT